MAREIKARMMQPPQARSDGYGVDHDLWIRLEGEDASHLPCPIPLARFAELVEPMTNSERADLYRALIIEFYNTSVPAPNIPQAPTSLLDLSEWDTYYDEKQAYDAQLASDVADATTYATQATSWIEGLAAFDDWPFDFILQAAS